MAAITVVLDPQAGVAYLGYLGVQIGPAIPIENVSLADGALRAVLPVEVEVPAECTVVVHNVEPTREQIMLALEQIPLDLLEQRMIAEQLNSGMASSMAAVARTAVAQTAMEVFHHAVS